MRNVVMRFVYSVLVCAALMLASCHHNTLSHSGPDPACDDGSGDRFIDCGNGTVTDTQNNNLIWTKMQTCFAYTLGFDAANDEVATLGVPTCNLTDGSTPGDWRLPTKDEWEAMVADAVALGCTHHGASDPPSITNATGDKCHADDPKGLAFPLVNIGGIFWSSTESDDPDRPWAAQLTGGTTLTNCRTCTLFYWAVRDP